MQQLRAAVQIAIHDEGIDLRPGEAGQGFLRLVFHRNVHVQTAQDAFQNTHFRPVARDHHRGKCHGLHSIWGGNVGLDNQRNESGAPAFGPWTLDFGPQILDLSPELLKLLGWIGIPSVA